jgi:hypothetical protein
MAKRPFSFSLFHLLVTLIFGFVSLGFSVNRALVYYYSGGWYHEEGIPATNQALTELSQDHGFELVLTENEADLNLDNLRTFDVIIWNNNTNAGLSVQSESARATVEQYVREGGSWIGINSALDHLDTWTYLADMVASRFLAHGNQEDNMVVVDDEALADPAWQEALLGVPAFETLHEEWMSFTVNPRGLPGITVIYTLDESANPDYSGPIMGDHPFVWVNKNPAVVGQGMAISNGFGHRGDIYTQKDGFAKQLLWALLQYAAGGIGPSEGCSDPFACNYSPLATINCNDCCRFFDSLGECTCLTLGGCGTPEYGCMDITACNYSLSAEVPCDTCCLFQAFDGTCTCPTFYGCPAPIYGCMDTLACNYDASANTPCDNCCRYWAVDKTCTCPTFYGCPVGIELTGSREIPGFRLIPGGISVTYQGTYSIQVLNVNGEKVLSNADTGPRSYPLSDLESGLYFINITTDTQNFLERIFIQ